SLVKLIPGPGPRLPHSGTESTRRPPGPGAPAQGPTQPKMPPGRVWLWFGVALLVNFIVVRFFLPGPEAPLTVPYTLFKEEVGKHNVKSIYSRGETMSGRFVAPVTFPPPGDAAAAANAKKQPSKAEPGALRRGPPRTAGTFITTLPA